jgi:hypothetical protein
MDAVMRDPPHKREQGLARRDSLLLAKKNPGQKRDRGKFWISLPWRVLRGRRLSCPRTGIHAE